MKRKTTAIDRHIGGRLRTVREYHGRSLVDVGAAIGVTYQQFQKYEKGVNRISAGHLCEVASLFRVPVSYFLPDEMKVSESELIKKLQNRIRILESRLDVIGKMADIREIET